MKKALLALGATVAASGALIAPAPAEASCSQPIEELGCIENVVCGGVGVVLQHSPIGRDSVHCIE